MAVAITTNFEPLRSLDLIRIKVNILVSFLFKFFFFRKKGEFWLLFEFESIVCCRLFFWVSFFFSFFFSYLQIFLLSPSWCFGWGFVHIWPFVVCCVHFFIRFIFDTSSIFRKTKKKPNKTNKNHLKHAYRRCWWWHMSANGGKMNSKMRRWRKQRPRATTAGDSSCWMGKSASSVWIDDVVHFDDNNNNDDWWWWWRHDLGFGPTTISTTTLLPSKLS